MRTQRQIIGKRRLNYPPQAPRPRHHRRVRRLGGLLAFQSLAIGSRVLGPSASFAARPIVAPPSGITITSLTADLVVANPIPVAVEEIEQTFVASFEAANINASGDTWNEAVSNLGDVIVSVFHLLGSLPAHQLGPLPRQEISVLRSYVRDADHQN